MGEQPQMIVPNSLSTREAEIFPVRALCLRNLRKDSRSGLVVTRTLCALFVAVYGTLAVSVAT